MADIKFSSNVTTAGLQNIASYFNSTANSGLLWLGKRIWIFSGTKPTDLDTIALTANLPAGVMIRWDYSSSRSVGVSVNSNALSFPEQGWSDATGSGTASYALVYTYAFSAGNIRHMFAMDVGLPGSGADILINDLNISAGTSYKILGFNVAFPNEYTY